MSLICIFGLVLKIIICKCTVTLRIVCLPMGISPFWQQPASCFPGADVSIVQLLRLCSLWSAHWEGMTLLLWPSHWQVYLVWHYRALRSEATALFWVARAADYQARTPLPRFAFVGGGVGGRGLRAQDEKWQMDEWSDVQQDRMTAGIGCQSVIGRERGACQAAVISTWLSSRAAGR